MGENQIHSAAMDIEFAPRSSGHRRAFQMPAGASAPPRRGPRRLVGFGALPQREVALIALAGSHSLALMDVVDLVSGQLAVFGVAQHVEIDVAAAGIGVAGLDQPLDQLHHLGHVAGGPRLPRWRQDTEGVVGGGERPLVGGRPFPPRPARRGGLVEDLVLDIGDVADECDVTAPRRQPAAQDVEGHAAAHMADVRQTLHGGAAKVDGDVPGPQRNEITHGTSCRVV